MLYMLLAAGSGGGMPAMGASGDSARLPEVGVLLGVAATGAAVLILDRLGSLTAAVAGTPIGPAGATGPAVRRVLAPQSAATWRCA
jgi:hypothetical protein